MIWEGEKKIEKKGDFCRLAVTVALGDCMELLLKVNNIQGHGEITI